MQGNDQHRYCFLCSKSVVDFSTKSEQEILKMLSNTSENVCGRFSKEQLIKINKKEHSLHPMQKWLTAIGSACLLSFPLVLFSKEIKPPIEQTSLKSNFNFQKQRDKELIGKGIDTIQNYVSGVVFDDKIPLPNAKVSLKGTDVVTHTDFDGKFELIIPNEKILNQMILTIDYVGYDTCEWKINSKKLPIKEHKIILVSPMLLGEVVIIKTKKWWQFWKD
jgi:hypothetical protein